MLFSNLTKFVGIRDLCNHNISCLWALVPSANGYQQKCGNLIIIGRYSPHETITMIKIKVKKDLVT
jgi:hypothetical protein